MNFVVLGTSEFTLACAQALHAGNATIRALISMPADVMPLNSADIKSCAKKWNINYAEFVDINSKEALTFLSHLSPDYILSTWPKLIGSELLAVPRRYVIGTHPTDLPRNRGRHPLHWIIDLGMKETKLSFFVMDEGVDSGDLLLQVPISVDESDSIVVLNAKVVNAGKVGIARLLAGMADGKKLPALVQDRALANYWRKRTPFDLIIDLRMCASHISRLIRAVAPPYLAAKIIFRSHVINIISGELVEKNLPADYVQQMEPGKILATEDRSITVKAADTLIQMVSAKPLPVEIREAKYIHPPAKYFAESGGSLLLSLGL